LSRSYTNEEGKVNAKGRACTSKDLDRLCIVMVRHGKYRGFIRQGTKQLLDGMLGNKSGKKSWGQIIKKYLRISEFYPLNNKEPSC
jgi:hypothetical protein